MAYIQITERCNMLCDHCGMSCTSEGEDMSMKVFKAIYDKIKQPLVVLGGNKEKQDILESYGRNHIALYVIL